MGQLLFLLALLVTVAAEFQNKKVSLEDIERDSLTSERPPSLVQIKATNPAQSPTKFGFVPTRTASSYAKNQPKTSVSPTNYQPQKYFASPSFNNQFTQQFKAAQAYIVPEYPQPDSQTQQYSTLPQTQQYSQKYPTLPQSQPASQTPQYSTLTQTQKYSQQYSTLPQPQHYTSLPHSQQYLTLPQTQKYVSASQYYAVPQNQKYASQQFSFEPQKYAKQQYAYIAPSQQPYEQYENVQYVTDNSIAQQSTQQQYYQQRPQYYYVQQYQAPSTPVQTVVDPKGGFQYVTYVPSLSPNSIPAELLNDGTFTLENSEPPVLPASSSNPTLSGSPKSQTKSLYYQPKRTQVHYTKSEFVPKREPKSLLESYVPSILQLRYLEEQRKQFSKS